MAIVLKNSQKGQTLIEAIVALGIAVTILAAIVSIVISSLSGSNFSKNQNLATSHAQETIEGIRRLAVSNFEDFKSTYDLPSYCVDSNNNLLRNTQNCNSIKTGIFIREVTFEHQSADCQQDVKAIVTVSWSDNKCTDRNDIFCHEVKIMSCFSDTTAIPSPI